MPQVQQQNAAHFLKGLGGSAMARLRRANGDTTVLRTNTLLREEEWEQIDEAVIPAAQERLVIVDDLEARGLIHPLRNIGVMTTEFLKVGDMSAASQSMSGAARGEKDLPDTETGIVPVPITFKEFEVEGRMLLSSQNRGEAIDVTAASLAGRQVAEKLEEMVISGGDIVLAGNDTPGLTTVTGRNTFTITTAWPSVTNTDAIKTDVLDMIQLCIDDNYFGPYWLYVPGGYSTTLEEDYDNVTTLSSRTVRDRLMSIDQIEGIRIADKLPVNNVVLVQMTRDVLDLAVGQRIDTVEWEEQGGAIDHMKVFAAMVQRIKNPTGICHGSV